MADLHADATNHIVVLANHSAKNNLGPILRSCAAYRTSVVVVVGESRWSTLGAHGSHKHIIYLSYWAWPEAICYLKSQNYAICGILPNCCESDTKPCWPVHMRQFHKRTAFIPYHGVAISSNVQEYCDFFIFVPLASHTASIDCASTIAIVLHHFSAWAKYDERASIGEKYVKNDTVQRTVNIHLSEAESKRSNRRLKKEGTEVATDVWELFEDEIKTG